MAAALPTCELCSQTTAFALVSLLLWGHIVVALLWWRGDHAAGDKLPLGALLSKGTRYVRELSAAPDLAAAYYYRAIASLQMKKMKDAKADLEKVVAMAPDSSEAKDAKELLDQMK